ncbi:MAG: FAD/NAD(P)-binding protein [Hadesarchaea archaeon]|nr:FAD/NAD(P)-binding protein [Hadesarchaea archaeon]
MKNPYLPELAVIRRVKEETPDTKTFRISFKNGEMFNYAPGQFVELTVFGYGEFPTSISSSPLSAKDYFESTVKCVGNVTAGLHRLPEGSIIGVRGPFGNGFPVEEMKGKNLLFVAGGIGLAPIRSLIHYAMENRKDYGTLKLLYGSRSPADLVFKDDIILNEEEAEKRGLEILLTVDKGGEGWKGNVGVVTTLFEKTDITPENTVVAICGPSIMMKFVVEELLKRRFKGDQLLLSLERMMSCGMGMCGHCMIGSKYVCQDGPVFTYEETREWLENVF